MTPPVATSTSSSTGSSFAFNSPLEEMLSELESSPFNEDFDFAQPHLATSPLSSPSPFWLPNAEDPVNFEHEELDVEAQGAAEEVQQWPAKYEESLVVYVEQSKTLFDWAIHSASVESSTAADRLQDFKSPFSPQATFEKALLLRSLYQSFFKRLTSKAKGTHVETWRDLRDRLWLASFTNKNDLKSNWLVMWHDRIHVASGISADGVGVADDSGYDGSKEGTVSPVRTRISSSSNNNLPASTSFNNAQFPQPPAVLSPTAPTFTSAIKPAERVIQKAVVAVGVQKPCDVKPPTGRWEARTNGEKCEGQAGYERVFLSSSVNMIQKCSVGSFYNFSLVDLQPFVERRFKRTKKEDKKKNDDAPATFDADMTSSANLRMSVAAMLQPEAGPSSSRPSRKSVELVQHEVTAAPTTAAPAASSSKATSSQRVTRSSTKRKAA